MLGDYRLDDTVRLVRSAYQIATEAMIWARLLITPDLEQLEKARMQRYAASMAYSLARGIYSREGPSGNPYYESPLKLKADEKLVNYLIVRLGKEVTRWALENNLLLPQPI